ncbi:MAG TPA: hypothetical protein PKO18_04100, partial [Chitinophagales bacterium]|nr:hypothetical protein [Chitinophagales bacterium]
FITLELGQPYTELGAYIVDTSGVYDANGNLVDSVFNSRPEITPDLTTEGVKSAVYFFTNGNHQECSIVRYIIVYKKQSNPPTGDISGLYKYSTAYNNVTKITDGVYYFDNVLNSTSVYRKGVPALFCQTTDSTFDIINQYFSRTISHYEQGFSTMLAEDRDLSISGSDEKIIYSSTAPFIKLKYRVYPNTSQIAFGAFGSLTSTNIKSTYFTLNKQ